MTDPEPDSLYTLRAELPVSGVALAAEAVATWAEWERAYCRWLGRLASAHTRRAYHRAWRELLAFAGRPPWDIDAAQLRAWVELLRRRRAAGRPARSAATVAQYLCGISSFYRFAMTQHFVPDGRAGQRPLCADNPAEELERPKVTRYARATYLQPSQARALLAAIPRDTVRSLRDFALLLCYLATGRRTAEVCQLRWGDLHHTGTQVFCAWDDPAAEPQELPPRVWAAIADYLQAAGRLAGMGPDDVIFVAQGDAARRLPTVDSATWQPNRPLSGRQVADVVKHYARLAGLDPRQVTVSALGHTAALLRRQVGDSPAAISAYLGQASPAATRHYLRRLSHAAAAPWATVESLLGL